MKKLFLILCAYTHMQSINGYRPETLKEWNSYINEEVNKSLNYQARLNNHNLRPDNKWDEIPRDFGTYDFIIVGAGTTGSVVANRLTENKKWKVLLLEAGDWSRKITKIPLFNSLSVLSSENWDYRTVPQKNSCQGMPYKQCPYFRGKAVGGTSILSSLIYTRGDYTDYDGWEKLDNPGWSYKDVLPYFKKSERIVQNTRYPVVDSRNHGIKGEWNVEFGFVSNQTKAFIRAHEELGYPLTDVSNPRPLGVSPVPLNIKNGISGDTEKTFILPILYRKNLIVSVKSFVTKILLHERTRRAVGVKFVRHGKTYSAAARKEVIVSAGVVNTPQLLMLSGIGPTNHLRKFGIPTIRHLEVGSVLRDQPMYFGLVFSSNSSSGQIKPLREYLRQWFHKRGPLLNPTNLQAISLHHTRYEDKTKAPDIELVFGAANCSDPVLSKAYTWTDETNDALVSGINRGSCFAIYPILLDVKSKGSVRLKSGSPFDFPLIDPNHLHDHRDFNKLYDAIQLGLKLTETKAFESINARLYPRKLKACSHFDFMCEDYMKCTIRQLTYNVWNSAGTCPMGLDPWKGAVVDHKLRVHGIQALRVADASVFPFTPRGYISAACVMIGEKLSDVIKWKYRARH